MSFDAQQRSSEGINGALTPARPHRTPQQQQQLQQRRHTNSKTLNDIYAATLDKMTTTAPAGQQQGRGRGGGALFGHEPGKLASGEGISLQETETRIVELERSEFDLKLRLFYMGEQLDLASGGADVLQLHKETMDAKLVSVCMLFLAFALCPRPRRVVTRNLLRWTSTHRLWLWNRLLVNFDQSTQQ